MKFYRRSIFPRKLWRALLFLCVFVCPLLLSQTVHADENVPSSSSSKSSSGKSSESPSDKKVAPDDYENALHQAYKDVLAQGGATQAQISAFVSCLQKETYPNVTSQTINALTSGNMDYEVSGEDADIFLNGVESCLHDNDLDELVISSGAEEAASSQTSEGNTEENNAVSSEDSDSAPKNDASKTTSDTAGGTDGTDTSATHLLLLSTGLTLLTIILFALFLLIRGQHAMVGESADS